MLLDDFLPEYDVSEYHEIHIKASPEEVYKTVLEVDLVEDSTFRALMKIRTIFSSFGKQEQEKKPKGLSLNDLQGSGFISLGRKPNDEIVFGLIGEVWRPVPNMVQVLSHEFQNYHNPSMVKVAANLKVTSIDENLSCLSTETRIMGMSPKALKKFKFYWWLIGPFSGLIRSKWLKLIKKQAKINNNFNE